MSRLHLALFFKHIVCNQAIVLTKEPVPRRDFDAVVVAASKEEHCCF